MYFVFVKKKKIQGITFSSRDQFSRIILTEYKQCFYSNDTKKILTEEEGQLIPLLHTQI